MLDHMSKTSKESLQLKGKKKVTKNDLCTLSWRLAMHSTIIISWIHTDLLFVNPCRSDQAAGCGSWLHERDAAAVRDILDSHTQPIKWPQITRGKTIPTFLMISIMAFMNGQFKSSPTQIFFNTQWSHPWQILKLASSRNNILGNSAFPIFFQIGVSVRVTDLEYHRDVTWLNPTFDGLSKNLKKGQGPRMTIFSMCTVPTSKTLRPWHPQRELNRYVFSSLVCSLQVLSGACLPGEEEQAQRK